MAIFLAIEALANHLRFVWFFDFYFCMQNAGELKYIVRLFSGFKIDEEEGKRTFGGFMKYVSDLPDLKKAMFELRFN